MAEAIPEAEIAPEASPVATVEAALADQETAVPVETAEKVAPAVEKAAPAAAREAIPVGKAPTDWKDKRPESKQM